MIHKLKFIDGVRKQNHLVVFFALFIFSAAPAGWSAGGTHVLFLLWPHGPEPCHQSLFLLFYLFLFRCCLRNSMGPSGASHYVANRYVVLPIRPLVIFTRFLYLDSSLLSGPFCNRSSGRVCAAVSREPCLSDGMFHASRSFYTVMI